MACDSIRAVTSAGPRAPKRKDYQRVALAAAQQSAQAQAQAHVLVLEAQDRIADADSHLRQAQTDRDTAVQHRTEVLAAFADLVGSAEAARRLELTPTAVRTAQRAAAQHRPPDHAEPPAAEPPAAAGPDTTAAAS